MNKRLDNAIEAARRTLGEHAQEELAAIVEDYVSHQSLEPAEILAPEQMAELERRMARPFEAADPERVRAIFSKHGIQADLRRRGSS